MGLVALATVVGKGLVIPGLLRRAMRAANIDRELEPFIGFVPSLLLGAGGTIAAVALARALPLLPEHAGSLLVPGAIASVLTGFILLIGRAKAISQVCGYLILENGIYLFGLLLIHSTPLLVEAGIPPRPHGRRVRHRHHRGPHPARLRFARHPQTHRAPRMNALLLIIVPLVGAALAALWPSNRTRPWLLPAVGLVHVVLAFWLLIDPPAVAPDAWLGFDPLARAVLPAVSLLFLVCAAYGVSYLRMRSERPNRVFVALLLAVLGLLSAGHQARHLGLLWIATEAVTLAAVPLLHFNGTPRAFEATWKYLLVGGTGIALSLLGSFCLGYASLHGGGGGDLTFAALTRRATGLSRPWVLTAWVLLLVGYGTKMGLAPMHTWKPDAYGEAPGIVGAILAGGVTTVAFTAILRVRAVVGAAGEGAIADRTLLVIGLFSMLVAALFLLGTRDFKRMLAYSSVEHMGILSIGAALGGAGVCGGAVPRVEQRPDQGRAVSERGQHPPRGRFAFDGRRARHVRAHAALGGDLCHRDVRRHGLPALRSVLQRTAGRARRARLRARGRHRDVSRLPAARLLRSDPRGLRHRGRPPAHGGAERAANALWKPPA